MMDRHIWLFAIYLLLAAISGVEMGRFADSLSIGISVAAMLWSVITMIFNSGAIIVQMLGKK